MGIVRSWIYADGDGQAVIHQHVPSVHPHYTFSLALSGEDSATLALVGKINRTLEQYRLNGMASARHGEIEAIHTVRAALDRSVSLHGFEKEDDHQALALDCLHWHSHFDLHPQVRMLLSPQERPPHTSYQSCTQLLADTVRKKMCDELVTTSITPPTY